MRLLEEVVCDAFCQHPPILIHRLFQECILSCTAVAIGLVKQTEEKETLCYDVVRWKDRILLLLLFC